MPRASDPPAVAALRRARVHFYLVDDAVARGEVESDELSGLILPPRQLHVHEVARTDRPPVTVLIGDGREVSAAKVADAVEGTVASIRPRTQADALTRVLGAKRPRGEPPRTIVDQHALTDSRHIVLPSGTDGRSILVSARGIADALEAFVLDVTEWIVWERIEPHFAVTADGIRSLDPDKDYLRVSPSEIYFDEVRQIISVGESDEYMECFDRAVVAAKRLHPKPPAEQLAAEHYAFLKER